MGIKLPRQKAKNRLIKFIYHFDKILPFSNKQKFRFYLNLEWAFDRLCHEYSFKLYTPETHPIRINTKRFLLERLNVSDIVLDLGCHEGVMSKYLAQHCKFVTGIDNNQIAIDKAKKNLSIQNLEFVCDDAHNFLSKTEKKYTVLILSHILEHLDDPASFLARYAPFFKNIYIELPDFDKTFLNHYRNEHGSNSTILYTDADHVSEFDREELISIVEGCGLKIESTDYRFGVQKLWCKF